MVQINGKMLSQTTFFSDFDLLFLSQLTIVLSKEAFIPNDNIIQEGRKDKDIYFIARGEVFLIHKKTKSYIKELKINECFGEVAFFSDFKRSCTIKAKEITEVIKLQQENFLEIC